MYCPVCFNNSLNISNHGVVHILVNGKQMDTGRFLYNIEKTERREMYQALEQKLDDVFKWLQGFRNQDPVQRLQLISTDFACEHGCRLGVNSKFSVVDNLIEKSELQKMLSQLSEKYMMNIEIEDPL